MKPATVVEFLFFGFGAAIVFSIADSWAWGWSHFALLFACGLCEYSGRMAERRCNEVKQ